MKVYDTGTLPIPEEVTFISESEGGRISYTKSQRNKRTANVKALGWKGATRIGETEGSALWPNSESKRGRSPKYTR